jgi:hypothetical protein
MPAPIDLAEFHTALQALTRTANPGQAGETRRAPAL